MPPPGTYIDITTIPFSRLVTTAEFNGGTFGGIANEVWFRYVASAGGVLGVRPNVERVLTLTTSIFASDGTTVLNSIGSNRPLGIAVASGSTYYVRIQKSPSGAIGSNFTAEFDTRPYLTTIPDGAIIINDFNFGAPAIVFDTSGTVLGYKENFPAAEFGAMLANGRVLLETGISGAQVFDADLNYVLTVGALGPSITIARGNGQWWVVETDGTVKTVSSDGLTVTTVATLPAQPASFGVSLDETILYYVDADSPIVKRWDLVNNVALTDLYTEPGFDNAGDGDTMGLTINFTPNGELLVLSDDSMVTWWLDWVNGNTNFLHLSPAGVLLNRITVTGFLVDHPQLALEGPNYIFAWLQDPSQIVAKIGIIDLTTGLFTVSFTQAEFASMRNGNPSDPLYYDDMFGPETSCIALRRGGADTGGGGGGGVPEIGVIGPILWWRFAYREP